MVEFKDYLINGLIVTLFMICLFTFAINFTNVNKPIDMDTEDINLAGLEEAVESTREASKSGLQSIAEDNPIISAGELIFSSIFGVGKIMANSLTVFYNLTFGTISNVLGIPPLVTGTVGAILLISLIFGIWKLVKVGQ